MKHIILGTAGHVDHGKTSLIKALTDIDCDTHKEEKDRGITINLGFSHLDLPSKNSIGIIDVPGHKDFINTMISGVGSIDIALLVIAADSGIMPQTNEHLNILKTLEVKNIIVALTKSDLVDEDILELATEEIKEVFEDLKLESPKVIPVSTVSKNGLSQLIHTLEEEVENTKPKKVEGIFRMYIDRIFTVKGLGSVLTGSVLSGKVENGDQVYLLPNEKDKFKIKSIQRHGEIVNEAISGDRSAMNISGIKKDDITKGAVLCDQIIPTTSMIDAKLSVFDERINLKTWSTVMFYSGTFESLAKVHLLNKDSVKKDEEAIVQIHLEKPAVIFNGDKYIIRQSSADRTIGGGEIIDVQPNHHKKRTSKMIEQLENLNEQIQNKDKLENQIILELDKLNLPILLSDLSQRISTSENDIIESISNSGNLIQLSLDKEIAVVKSENHFFYKEEIVKELEMYHAKYYLLSEGINSNYFTGKFKFSKNPLAKKFIESLFLEMKANGQVKRRGTTWALSSHTVNISGSLKIKLDWLLKKYSDYQLQLPVIKDIEAESIENKISKEEFRMFLKYFVDNKQLIKFQDNFIYSGIYEKVKEKTLQELKNNGGSLYISEFRSINQCTKKIVHVLVGLMEEEKLITVEAEENMSKIILKE